MMVQLVAARLQFVIHIQCADEREVHINQLGRQVEISLQVRCIYDVNNHVRRLFYQLFAYV